MFTTKFTKQKGRLPRPLVQKFAEGGRVGPFDKYLSPYDKFERSENVEDRTRDSMRAAKETPMTSEDVEDTKRYYSKPPAASPLGYAAGLNDLPQRRADIYDPPEMQTLSEAEKKQRHELPMTKKKKR